MPEVQSFLYRGQRLHLDLPATLDVEGEILRGRTIDLSDTGALVRLDGLVRPESLGVLHIEMGTGRFEVRARVVHIELFDVGLSFCFGSQMEQDFMKTLIRVLSKKLGRR